MPSLFSHVFIPLAILIIFSKKLKIEPKKIILLSFIGILPDADIILFHRASFHNIFILMIPILAYLYWKKEDILIVIFYLMSHLVLDIFNGGVYLLYPFNDHVFFSNIEIWINKINGINYILDYGINDKIVNIRRRESIFSGENIGTVVLLFTLLLVSMIKNRTKIVHDIAK